MKVALYARVSTDEQDFAGQLARMRQYSQFQNWEIAGEWTDKESGANDSRPGFDEMLSKRSYNAILVTKLDRVMRSLIHLENLVKLLDNRRVSLIAIDEGIDTGAEGDDYSKRLVRQILGSVAEWERKRIVSRVNEGMARAKKYGTKSGRPIGRPKLPDDKLTKEGLRSRQRRSNLPVVSLNIKEAKIGDEQT